eukprot:CAMPEP_0116898662 /NCGR_PEP_ID=MMETSP0467-20121206/7352_1 /TAXON_ID=283647 /ORGANISM="Mesodinium pulex, Strain SPMC105" /LENGTH=77 /DNA_ID=CAMNT_0004570949 /DNA_START=1399 /DNA_END=1632 /DNA_ORIENTATION=-
MSDLKEYAEDDEWKESVQTDDSTTHTSFRYSMINNEIMKKAMELAKKSNLNDTGKLKEISENEDSLDSEQDPDELRN